MAGRGVSPGAALLRSSRMFSMPAPIPAPPGDFSSATKHYSPTATINYPTHLTVTTTSSSRVNGDWGFKRPFPLKTTTNTTYPLARVRQVDSIEHVTDFQSASDHTMTLQKFQEMNLPISVPLQSGQVVHKPKSVFEESSDVTALSDEQKVASANKRWKFAGPWLAGMTDGDFNRFIEKEVRGRRSEFRAFLRENLASEMTKDQAMNTDDVGEKVEIPTISASSITDEAFMDYLRELRQDRMALYSLVGRFLDLAPVELDTQYKYIGSMAPDRSRVLERGSPYGENGPPITHPSAGLSYLRTRNFLENHAIYGPQRHHAPVKARVLKPTHHNTGNYRPSIGVAGFVASPPVQDTVFNMTKGRNPSKFVQVLHVVNLEEPGGSKLYVQPTIATVDSSGRVCINIDETNAESEVVQKEMVGEASVFEQVLKERETPEVPRNPNNRPTFSASFDSQRRGRNPRQGSAHAYGF